MSANADVLTRRFRNPGERYARTFSTNIIGKTAHELWPQATANLIAEHDKKLGSKSVPRGPTATATATA
jgi:hypothetical protein